MADFGSCASSSIILNCLPPLPMISPNELDGTLIYNEGSMSIYWQLDIEQYEQVATQHSY